MTAKKQNHDQIRAYGLTHGQNKEIQKLQIEKRVPMIEANNAENFQDEYFEKDFKGYKIQEHEKVHYHVAIESRLFEQQSGKRLSRATVQVYDTTTYRMLKNMKPFDGFHGKLVHILHDPTRVKAVPVNVDPPKDERIPEFASVKEAKEFFRTTFQKEPTKSWNLAKTIQGITKEFNKGL